MAVAIRRLSAQQVTRRIAESRDVAALRDLFHELGPRLDRIHLVTLLHRCASLGASQERQRWIPRAAAALHAAAARRPMAPRELANALWAVARLQLHGQDPLMVRLCELLRPQLGACKPQELSNVAWALARAQSRSAMLADVAAASGKAASTMDTQHLANVSWAFGHLQTQQAAWFDPLVAELLKPARASSLPPRHLVNVLWGFARVGTRQPAMLHLLGNCIAESPRLGRWSMLDVSMAVWAFASLETIHGPLFRRVAQEARAPGRLAACGPQELQNLAWAFAVAARRAPPAPLLRHRRGPPAS